MSNRHGQQIVSEARKDVGYQERTDKNDHPIYAYYRAVAGVSNRAGRGRNYLPTCGCAVYAWHRQAGYNPPVKAPGLAANWTRQSAPGRVPLGRYAKPASLAKLRPGMVIGFQFVTRRKVQNHVGLIESVYPFYAVTIEANTSIKSSIGSYAKTTYGVIRKQRFYGLAYAAADWRNAPPADTSAIVMLRHYYEAKLTEKDIARKRVNETGLNKWPDPNEKPKKR